MTKRTFLLTNSILLRRYEEKVEKDTKDKIILEEKDILLGVGKSLWRFSR